MNRRKGLLLFVVLSTVQANSVLSKDDSVEATKAAQEMCDSFQKAGYSGNARAQVENS